MKKNLIWLNTVFLIGDNSSLMKLVVGLEMIMKAMYSYLYYILTCMQSFLGILLFLKSISAILSIFQVTQFIKKILLPINSKFTFHYIFGHLLQIKNCSLRNAFLHNRRRRKTYFKTLNNTNFAHKMYFLLNTYVD